MFNLQFTVSLLFIVVTATLFIAPASAINDNSHLQNPEHLFWHDHNDLPTIRLSFSQESWDLLLTSTKFDREEVSAEFTYFKSGQEYILENIGAKLSGNTSFTIPQSEDGSFIQASFTLDFDEFVDDQVLSGVSALKLKRFNNDSTFVHEPLSNHIMQNFGLWTVHSSTHVRLEIQIAAGDIHYFGMYRTNESVNRHEYLDKRFGHDNDGGALWQGNRKRYGPALFSSITPTWEGIGDFDLASFEYKGKGSKYEENREQLIEIAQNFTNLEGEDFRAYIERHLNIPIFLKSLASEAVLGHWDGFWGNNNNYMFYIDENEILHLIPFDTDNALGTSLLVDDTGEQDPFAFGSQENTPLLVSKVLAIEKYRKEYADYLLTLVRQNNLLNQEYAADWIANIHELIENHLDNVTGENQLIADRPARWSNQADYRLYDFTSGRSFYRTKQQAVLDAIGVPIADAGADVQLLVGEMFKLDASHSFDPNGEIVSVIWSNEQNGGASTVSFNNVGSYPVILTITDDEGYSATDKMIITVVEPPIIESTPTNYAVTNQPYSYSTNSFIYASGTGPISYRLIQGPFGMTVSAEGFVTWTPSENQQGDHEVVVQASNTGGSYPQDFVISTLLDTDSDGLPDNCDMDCQDFGLSDDLDDDNDSLPDSYELAYEFDPLNPNDATLDSDNDSISNKDEFGLGTNPLDSDSDDDGIADNIDNNPLLFERVDEKLYSGKLIILPDVNGDKVKELGVFRINNDLSQVELELLDGLTEEMIRLIVWEDVFTDVTLTLHIIDDMNGNGVNEVGVFGTRDSTINAGKTRLFVNDLLTGNRVDVFNWPANWRQTKVLVLADMTGDGISEIGLQGRFKDGSRPQLVIKNGATTSSIDTFSYPNQFIEPHFHQHSDTNNDGVAEISTFGRLTRNNKIQIKIANGNDSQDRFKAYNFPDKWKNIKWVKLDDSNGDDIADWGLFGTNKQDGRAQLIVKNGADPRGTLRLHAWPSAIVSSKFFSVPDINGDGVDEVAAAGIRDNGRHQFQIQDATDRNNVLVNYNLNLKLEDVSYHVLPDLTGDGLAEIGFMGINSATEYELHIRDGDFSHEVLRIENLGSDWSEAPSITNLGDTDNDGLPNLLFHGKNADDKRLLID